MSKSQQKPKKVSGTRNSDRRNGKAWSKNHGHLPASKGKPSGRSIMGFARERVEKWAAQANMSVEDYTEMMREERRVRKYQTRLNRQAFAHLIKGAESLYRDGTLKHQPMPRRNGDDHSDSRKED